MLGEGILIAARHAREREAAEGDDTMEQIAIRRPKALLARLDDDVAVRLDDLIRELIVEAYEAREGKA